MILEFQDGTQLEVFAIYGMPRMVEDKQRDVWKILVLRDQTLKEELQALFQDHPEKTNRMYTYGEAEQEDGTFQEEKVLSGQGYNMFLSIEEDTFKMVGIPGRLYQEQSIPMYAIYLAQMTYEEYREAFPDDPIEP